MPASSWPRGSWNRSCSPVGKLNNSGKMSAETILRFVKLVQLSTSLLLVTHPSFAGSLDRRDVLQVLEEQTPQFDVIIDGIDANVGETVLLPCTVRNLGDKVVSWIRTQDLSILTSDAFTFSADSRFESVHNSVADFWGLRIRGVRLTDSGQYECQVNTDPKMNLAVNLSIIDSRHPRRHYLSRAHIKSAKEVVVRSGSTLSLTCEITANNVQDEEDVLMKKARVRWLHEANEISSKFDEGGVSVETDYREGRISSRLILNGVQARHAGSYTCTRQATKEDTIKLQVTEAEHVEAMQRDSAYTSGVQRVNIHILSMGIYLLLYIT